MLCLDLFWAATELGQIAFFLQPVVPLHHVLVSNPRETRGGIKAGLVCSVVQYSERSFSHFLGPAILSSSCNAGYCSLLVGDLDLERPVDTVVPPLFQYRRRFVDFVVLGHGLVCYCFQKSPEVVFRSRRSGERNCACWKLCLP